MMFRQFKAWLLMLGLLHSVSVFADISVDTESLRVRFNDYGDLLSAEACFPACSGKDVKTRVLSHGQGMLVLSQDKTRQLHVDQKHSEEVTTLTFAEPSGRVLHRWLIPDKGWKISLSSASATSASLQSGEAFRPTPSSGFGYLLEHSRYVIFDGSAVESIGLREDERVELRSEDWFGFRNRFWTAMVLPAAAMSIAPVTGDSIEDARIELATAQPGQYLDLDLYLGPIEPSALSLAAPELENLMYSGLWSWLHWICQAFYHLLNFIALAVPNWGLAVMVLSLLVGILMQPLNRIAERLQDQVREIDTRLAPLLADIKKSYKGAEQSEKIIAMYKDAGVHPLYSLQGLAGVLVVIPIFIGAFNMLAENIHLSGESFLWIADLSNPDAFLKLPFRIPFFGEYLNLLPFIMTGLSIVASKLHSLQAGDMFQQRKQARNLVIMSVGFLVLFYTFPAGMVLYWTTTNLVSLIKALWKKRKLGDN